MSEVKRAITDNPTITVYITKYALTKGIEKFQAVQLNHIKPNPGSVIRVDRYFGDHIIEGIPVNCTQYFALDDWHTTPEDAILQAEKMRNDKVQEQYDILNEAQKQILELESMKFEVKE